MNREPTEIQFKRFLVDPLHWAGHKQMKRDVNFRQPGHTGCSDGKMKTWAKFSQAHRIKKSRPFWAALLDPTTFLKRIFDDNKLWLSLAKLSRIGVKSGFGINRIL